MNGLSRRVGDLWWKLLNVMKSRERKEEEHERHAIPAAVTCTFFEDVLRGKGTFQGFIQDISLGGAALEVRDDFLTIKESLLLYTTLEMTVAFNLSDGIHRMHRFRYYQVVQADQEGR